MRERLTNLLHPCQPWRMTLSRLRWRLQEERGIARVWVCETVQGGHVDVEEYDHLNGSVVFCGRSGELLS